jgi:hypothetical protein
VPVVRCACCLTLVVRVARRSSYSVVVVRAVDIAHYSVIGQSIASPKQNDWHPSIFFRDLEMAFIDVDNADTGEVPYATAEEVGPATAGLIRTPSSFHPHPFHERNLNFKFFVLSLDSQESECSAGRGARSQGAWGLPHRRRECQHPRPPTPPQLDQAPPHRVGARDR